MSDQTRAALCESCETFWVAIAALNAQAFFALARHAGPVDSGPESRPSPSLRWASLLVCFEVVEPTPRMKFFALQTTPHPGPKGAVVLG